MLASVVRHVSKVTSRNIYIYIILPRHIFYDVMVFDRQEEEGCRSDRLVSDIGSRLISRRSSSSVHHDAGGRRWQVDARLDSESERDSGRVCPIPSNETDPRSS